MSQSELAAHQVVRNAAAGGDIATPVVDGFAVLIAEGFVVDGSGTRRTDDGIVLVEERAQVAFRCLHLVLGERVDEFVKAFPG